MILRKDIAPFIKKPCVYAAFVLAFYLSKYYNYHTLILTQIKVVAMPAKASGEIKTRIIHNTQKNGDIYIYERQTVYDLDKKYNRVISSKLLSKIPKGSNSPVPTRPKKPDFGKGQEVSGEQ